MRPRHTSLTAGSGALYVRQVIGDVHAVDAAGALFVEGIAGTVRIRDGSGGIHVRDVEGDVVIEVDFRDERKFAATAAAKAKADELAAERSSLSSVLERVEALCRIDGPGLEDRLLAWAEQRLDVDLRASLSELQEERRTREGNHELRRVRLALARSG